MWNEEMHGKERCKQLYIAIDPCWCNRGNFFPHQDKNYLNTNTFLFGALQITSVFSAGLEQCNANVKTSGWFALHWVALQRSAMSVDTDGQDGLWHQDRFWGLPHFPHIHTGEQWIRLCGVSPCSPIVPTAAPLWTPIGTNGDRGQDGEGLLHKSCRGGIVD